MAKMEGLVIWLPDHTQTVTLRVGQHLSPNFESLKTCVCVCVHKVTYNCIYGEAKSRRGTKG